MKNTTNLKEAQKACNRKYYLAHKEEQKVKSRKYYLANKEQMKIKVSSYQRKLKETNPEKLKEWHNRYKQKHAKKLQIKAHSYFVANKERYKQNARKFRKANPNKSRLYTLKSQYGLTEEDYNQLLQAQNSACAICNEALPLCVDHNHRTGKVRGLLCRVHNAGLGQFGDDPRLLRKAAEYLEKNGGQ